MDALDRLRQSLPDEARDLKVNLQTVLGESSLSADQRWGVAVASAIATRNPALRAATLSDAASEASAAAVEDGRAAAALMGMNNVYYRFRHQIGKDAYGSMPARLRMQRLVKPASNRADFELFSLAVSAINGCEACVQAHEKAVLDGGLTDAHVHDAVRIAATFAGAAVALDTVSAEAAAIAAPPAGA